LILDHRTERAVYPSNPEDMPNKKCFSQKESLKRIVWQECLKDVIRGNNGESELVVNWLSASRYHHRKRLVELEFSPQLKPYLLKLKKDFTKYKFANVLVLKSKYSIRMYEPLKRYLNIGKRRFTIEQLRNLLEIEPGKLTNYGHMKQRVLLKTQKELADKTDISFEFEETKVGHMEHYISHQNQYWLKSEFEKFK
jgi:plasmid replication initiation protein